jgi:para-aminobenzoate synthetase component 1
MKLSPLDAAARLRGERGRVLLHSGRNDDGLGQSSFVAAAPVASLEASGTILTERDRAGQALRQWSGDVLEASEEFCARHGVDWSRPSADEDLLPRVVGYWGYDAGSVHRRAAGSLVPDLWLGAYRAVARWRGDDGNCEIVGDPGEGEALAAKLSRPAPRSSPPLLGPLRCTDSAEDYRQRVRRVLDYIAAGDVYQVNLSRRHTAEVLAAGDPAVLFAALNQVAPAPYGGFIEADGATVISGSPECFLRKRGRGVETRPIKGTRKRTGDAVGDGAAAADLATSEKDSAEHLMIVDLERNDLGRVAVTGSVRVDGLGYVVELPALFHRVSRVRATLRPEVGLAELLRATFPGGSITGAPKIRAMEIIDELEPHARGPYCGAIGHVGADGSLELAVAIRIAVLTPSQLSIHVGGGIVADSDPEAELGETEDKLAGWRAALRTVDVFVPTLLL